MLTPLYSLLHMSERLWDVIFKTVSVVVIALVGAVINNTSRLAIIQHDLTSVKETRFTAKDGSDLRKEVVLLTRDSQIQFLDSLHKLENTLKRELPPDWLKGEIVDIKASLKDIEGRLRKMENHKP